jgi:hypothetical protein
MACYGDSFFLALHLILITEIEIADIIPYLKL